MHIYILSSLLEVFVMLKTFSRTIEGLCLETHLFLRNFFLLTYRTSPVWVLVFNEIFILHRTKSNDNSRKQLIRVAISTKAEGILIFIELGHDIFLDGHFISSSIGIILTTWLSSFKVIISFRIYQSMDSCERMVFKSPSYNLHDSEHSQILNKSKHIQAFHSYASSCIINIALHEYILCMAKIPPCERKVHKMLRDSRNSIVWKKSSWKAPW
jgi:hypothetical protein